MLVRGPRGGRVADVRGRGDAMETNAEEVVEGRIDLLFEEAGRLVLVDYKTDAVAGAGLRERARTYREALAAYAEAARRLTGRPVEALLYFIAADEEVPLTDLDDGEARAGDRAGGGGA